MNSTHNPTASQRLRLLGPCAGCDAPLPTAGAVAVRPPHIFGPCAGWMCRRCAERTPDSLPLRRRIDAALARLTPADATVATVAASAGSSEAFWRTPAFAEAFGAAHGES